ncbi:superoxide dismutase family protein [Tistrella sp. BH-R2-4]|uniref:Superoxide dismutase family protein n=1 Tax=Tistrella arctica TaxID=3133430 RepID=A0ABU9YSI7_9PROT
MPYRSATRAATVLAAIALAAPAVSLAADDARVPAAETTSATAHFVDASGRDNGSATLTGTPTGVLIATDLRGLPPGKWVAFHIHEGDACDAEQGHKTAGGHFNPDDRAHGYLAEGGPHAGDMPNQKVAQDGTLAVEVFNGAVRLDQGDTGIMGRTLMIHAGRDDYRSQPSGAAGDRIACGVIGGE